LSLKARKAGEFEKAYEMTAPGYRAVAKLIRFKAENEAVPGWVNTEVVNVSCEEPVKCIAKIRVDFRPILGVRVGDVVTTHIDETWLQENGQWWLFPKL
jgi:hypothetical protein